ncbi:DUF2863 family protein [Nitrosospira multiformis]|jgi:hypothetical protein|uniref:DUF2863 family protein n=1 Tax=Nitrosospira multiformis TaxID=1231 RepID=A0A1I7H6T9_9PROT|nr:DUF2863 family protein [Nitrosospira multiformis]SFU56413.1 Protein of unknown function [Nitrosospira multiformis]
MKKLRVPHRTKSARMVQELVRLAAGLATSGSRVEDAFWENRLAAKIHAQLRTGDDQNLEAALDQLYDADPGGYSEFMYAIEAAIECSIFTRGDHTYDVLMFAVPVLTWSRFSIPSGPMAESVLSELRGQLQVQVLADDARLALADCLFSPDQLPRGYHLTHELARKLWSAAVTGQRDLHMNPQQLAETGRFLSDTRYLLGGVAVPQGKPMFRWQQGDAGEHKGSNVSTLQFSKEQILHAWQTHGTAVLLPLFQGCAFELLMPDGFFSAWRAADRLARPYSVRATVDFLETTLSISPDRLRAVIAPFYDQWLEEYRIGFTLKDRDNVLYGIIWGLVGDEDENTDSVAQIEAALRECGVTQTILLQEHFLMEYCEECGGPLFPNADGEIVHAEFPEEGEVAPIHLH